MAFAASPLLVLTGLINWDLLSVATVCGALWAWSRGRPLLAGVMIGLGTAIKLYPLFLLGPLLVVCLRRREPRPVMVAIVAAGVTWLAVNLPGMIAEPSGWAAFWGFNNLRTADLGSLWLVAQQAGYEASVHTINVVSWGFFGVVCLAVLVLAVRAPRPPRIPQLAFL